MTQDLKSYVDGLVIRLYRLMDGSFLIAEEGHRDISDGYVVLRRPLQIKPVVTDGSLKTAFLPWMPGSDDHIRISINNVIAESEASFDQKFAYSRYYLLDHLQKYLPADEFSKIAQEGLPQTKINQKSLTSKLGKGQRFELN